MNLKLTSGNIITGKKKMLTIAFLFLFIMIVIATFKLTQLEQNLRKNTLTTLKATLNSTQDLIKNIWLKNLYKDIDYWLSIPEINNDIHTLLLVKKNKATLLKSPSQQKIREHFYRSLIKKEITGIFIISPDYKNIMSMHDNTVGQRNVIAEHRPEFLDNAFKGKKQMVPPLLSNMALPNKEGKLVKNYPTMFILIPIIINDKVVAVLALRLNPFHTFSQIPQAGRSGTSVETYLFDDKGVLISESRFNQHLNDIGLIKSTDHSLLTIKVIDPGQNLLKMPKGKITPLIQQFKNEAPFTLMAANALMGKSGSSEYAYRDYRGVPVLGAWIWDEELGIGLTTEIDEEEAMIFYQNTQLIVLSLFTTTLIISFLFLYIVNRIQRNSILTVAKSETFLRTVLDNAIDGIITIDEDGVIGNMNQACLDIFGYLPDEINGKNINTLMENFYTKNKVTKNKEITGFHKSGNRLPLRMGLSHNIIENKKIFMGIIQDLTVQKKQEEQLRQALKLESIGQLTAGIAHEINTPTQYVSDNTSFLKSSFESIQPILALCKVLVNENNNDDSQLNQLDSLLVEADIEFLLEEIPSALEQTAEGLHRISTIVSAMKSFSHSSKGEFHSIDLTETIETTLTVARNEWRYIAELQTEFSSDLSQVVCMRDEFNQVVLNIIVNAAHAITDRIEAQEKNNNAESDKGVIKVKTYKEDNDAVITIEDNGTGMPPETVRKIFDPFFTTKDVGKGTGQGLSMAYTVIVEKHHGQLYAESTVGKGTIFTIRLPLSAKTKL